MMIYLVLEVSVIFLGKSYGQSIQKINDILFMILTKVLFDNNY